METRQQSSYENLLIDYVTAIVTGDSSSTTATAIEEIIAGTWARAVGSARIMPDTPVTRMLTTSVLQAVGRAFIESGESLWLLDTDSMRLIQAAHWDVHGTSPDPMSWTYQVDIEAPDAQISRREMAEGVLHFRHAPRPIQPWVGVSPLLAAETTRQMLRTMEGKLVEEVSSTQGVVIPVPSTHNTAQLQAQLRELKGKVVLVPSTASGWGEGRMAAPQKDWQKTRLGADPPAPLIELRKQAMMSTAAAAGIPPELITGGLDANDSREAWRQFLHGSIVPVGNIIQEELRLKLQTNIMIDFEELFASDVQGRARAFGSLVQGGMAPEWAATFTGFKHGTENTNAPTGPVYLPRDNPKQQPNDQ